MRAQYELEYERNLASTLAAELEAEFAGVRGLSSAEYQIIGTDDRVRVTDTLQIPFRFICCIELRFIHPTTNDVFPFRGSGTLISDRHVLTAAHNALLDMSTKNRTFPINWVRPNSMLVAPARNDRNFPGHFSEVQTARVSPVWQATANRQRAAGNTAHIAAPRNSDWALLTLRTPLGSRQPNAPVTMQLPAPPLAWWSHSQFGGGTRIRAYDNAHWHRLRNQSLNICGYPIDKCRHRPAIGSATQQEIEACANSRVPDMEDFVDWASTQWRSFGRIVNPFDASGLITYSIDTAPGNSGGPIWLNWAGFRNLVGIHTRRHGTTANAGVRITEPLLRQLRVWMRSDGVQPTF